MTTDEDLARLERAVEQVAAARGTLSDEYWEAWAQVFAARNDLAKESGKPYLTPVDLGFRLEPNAPDPILIRGRHDLLALNPHLDEDDQRRIALVWRACLLASLTPVNDEGQAGNRLSELGLGWFGAWNAAVVERSPLVAMFNELVASPPEKKHFAVRFKGAKHFVIALRDHMFHAVARGFEVTRLDEPNPGSLERALEELRPKLGHMTSLEW